MTGAPDLVLLATGVAGYEALVRSNLGEVAGRLARVGPEARAIATSTDLDDAEKERRVRRMTGATLADTLRLAGRLALVAAACALVIWAGSALAGVPPGLAVERAASLPGLLGITVAVAGWALLRRRLRRP